MLVSKFYENYKSLYITQKEVILNMVNWHLKEKPNDVQIFWGRKGIYLPCWDSRLSN